MDKRKVITAYRRGFITIQECGQILGLDSGQVFRIMNDPQLMLDSVTIRTIRPLGG